MLERLESLAEHSSIEWTDATWNPVTGCNRVSSGCDHCYALALAKRLKAMGNRRYQQDGQPRTSGPGFGVQLHEDLLDLPLRWKRPRRVFVNSMSDLFHSNVSDEFIRRVFTTMVEADHHIFQILTKRPRRLASLLPRIWSELGVEPPGHIWIGTSVEDQEWADNRVPLLLAAPSGLRFLSCEPLIGPIQLNHLLVSSASCVDWVIVGGESGHGHRTMPVEWVRSLRDECVSLGISFFFKQWGGRTPKAGGRMLDGTTWDEFPI